MLGTTLWNDEGPTLGRYYGTEIGSLEGFADGNADVKFDGFLLGARPGLVYGLKIVSYKVTALGFWYVKLIVITLGVIRTLCI